MAPPQPKKFQEMKLGQREESPASPNEEHKEEVVGRHMRTGEDVIINEKGDPCLAKGGKTVPDKCVVYF